MQKDSFDPNVGLDAERLAQEMTDELYSKISEARLRVRTKRGIFLGLWLRGQLGLAHLMSGRFD
jgi:hypothetical protein